MNYTAIGETVNLASYLETLNKKYRTEIIVSDTVYNHCREEFSFRLLDKIAAKGGEKNITIYELLGENEALANPEALAFFEDIAELKN